MKDAPSSSQDVTLSKEIEIGDEPVPVIDDTIRSKEVIPEKDFDQIDTKPSLISPGLDKIDNTNEPSNVEQSSKPLVSSNEEKKDNEKMEVDYSPQVEKDLKAPEQISMTMENITNKLDEETAAKEEMKEEPKMAASKELDDQTKLTTSAFESGIENESSLEKNPRLKEEIENVSMHFIILDTGLYKWYKLI